jgi:hypothetical protein
VNDAELDRLIAATAPVSEADARAWDIAGAEGQLIEDIVATVDTTGVVDCGPADTTAEAAADAGNPRVLPFPGAGRRPRRRLVAAVGAAAAVLALAGSATIAVTRDGHNGAATGPGAVGGIDMRPADPPQAFPAAPEDAAAAEPLPRLAGGLQGWAITFIDVQDSTGFMTMQNGLRSLDVSWAPADAYPAGLAAARRSSGSEGVEATLAGQPALTFDNGPGPASDGAGSYSTIAVIGDYTVSTMSGAVPVDKPAAFLTREEYDALVAGLQQYPADSWIGILPSAIVLPSQRPAVVDGMLTGVPLPPAFDAAGLRSAAEFQDRFRLGWEVAATVACGWLESWDAARMSGDQATAQAAIDAMATSRQWPILQEMSETMAEFPNMVWQLAAAMPTNGPVAWGADTPVSDGYRDALACEHRLGDGP